MKDVAKATTNVTLHSRLIFTLPSSMSLGFTLYTHDVLLTRDEAPLGFVVV